MKNFQFLEFSGPDELSREAARRFVQALAQAPKSKRYLVALSGGRIARNLCGAIATEAKRDPDLFNHVHFFWGDERCVPPDDPDSNFKLANGTLFRSINFPTERIHRIRGEIESRKAAAEAASGLLAVAEKAPNGQPILDLVFLGMGEDGHTASLFPEEGDRMIGDPNIFRPVTATKPPPQRISIGYQPLAMARQVWVLASGKGKEDALKRSLSGDGKTPLGKVIAMRNETLVFSDIAL